MDPREVPNVTINPYWDEVKDLPGGFATSLGRAWGPDWTGHHLLNSTLSPEAKVEGLMESSMRRDRLVHEYAWAIPDPATLNFLKEALPANELIVEIGAGTGYWAWQLTQIGLQVEAYDQFVPNTLHHPVRRGDAAMLDFSDADTLMLCWPEMSPMAEETLKRFTGSRLIYVGEINGCTADTGFFEELESNWALEATHSNVSFDGINDQVFIYKRQ